VQACVICLAFLLVGNIEFVQLVQPTLQHGAYWMAIWGRHALLIGLLAHVISTQFASGGRSIPSLRVCGRTD